MPSQVDTEVDHFIWVVDLANNPATGLDSGDFTLSLKRTSGGALISASEPLSVSEVGSGVYEISYTPTELGIYIPFYEVIGPYTLTPAPPHYQDEILPSVVSPAPTGPYLSTVGNFKTRFGVPGTASDSAIEMVLGGVTDDFQAEAGRVFFGDDELVEYPPILGEHNPLERPLLYLDRPPLREITEVHIRWSHATAWGAATLLPADAYWVEPWTGKREQDEKRTVAIVGGRCLPSPRYGPGLVKVLYAGGFETIPRDVEQSTLEILAVKYGKSGKGGGSYHAAGPIDIGDGAMAQIRVDDWPLRAREVARARRFS